MRKSFSSLQSTSYSYVVVYSTGLSRQLYSFHILSTYNIYRFGRQGKALPTLCWYSQYSQPTRLLSSKKRSPKLSDVGFCPLPERETKKVVVTCAGLDVTWLGNSTRPDKRFRSDF
ncbi:hypothetical protein L596_011338 [Steinernema carpocapsae]|uniref:Uncharacterized protein n=1 Tax=Steinernema carpocapsae TaxID=34508 RepID=A0A4U5NUG4_STECR|nr:hypothetical protein L596_011338 [Steinernema carpocapsae]